MRKKEERDRTAIPKRLEKFLPPRGDHRRERFEDAFYRLHKAMQSWEKLKARPDARQCQDAHFWISSPLPELLYPSDRDRTGV